MIGGERDRGLVFQQKREAFAELDDKAGLELARKIDLDEADVGAGQVTSVGGTGFGHAREINPVNAGRIGGLI
ncbi:MAG TPA: hypothetical protein VF258_05475 [Luteolibacter sp.]